MSESKLYMPELPKKTTIGMVNAFIALRKRLCAECETDGSCEGMPCESCLLYNQLAFNETVITGLNQVPSKDTVWKG